MIPDELRYTPEHEWVGVDENGRVRIGITDYAQDALGDIVFVQLPEPGTQVNVSEAIGEVESTKSVSEIYAPVTGRVAARNEMLTDAPELINTDPYGAGWMLEIEPDDRTAIEELLDAEGYRQLTQQ